MSQLGLTGGPVSNSEPALKRRMPSEQRKSLPARTAGSGILQKSPRVLIARALLEIAVRPVGAARSNSVAIIPIAPASVRTVIGVWQAIIVVVRHDIAIIGQAIAMIAVSTYRETYAVVATTFTDNCYGTARSIIFYDRQ